MLVLTSFIQPTTFSLVSLNFSTIGPLNSLNGVTIKSFIIDATKLGITSSESLYSSGASIFHSAVGALLPIVIALLKNPASALLSPIIISATSSDISACRLTHFLPLLYLSTVQSLAVLYLSTVQSLAVLYLSTVQSLAVLYLSTVQSLAVLYLSTVQSFAFITFSFPSSYTSFKPSLRVLSFLPSPSGSILPFTTDCKYPNGFLSMLNIEIP